MVFCCIASTPIFSMIIMKQLLKRRGGHKLRWQHVAHYVMTTYPPTVDICEGTPLLKEGIHQLRGQNFAIFWPTHLWQFLYSECGQKQTFFNSTPSSSCPRNNWMPPNKIKSAYSWYFHHHLPTSSSQHSLWMPQLVFQFMHTILEKKSELLHQCGAVRAELPLPLWPRTMKHTTKRKG